MGEEEQEEECGMVKGVRSGRSMGYNGRMEEKGLYVSRNLASVYRIVQYSAV